MKTLSTILLTTLLALAGCGDDADSGASYSPAPKDEAATAEKRDTAAAPARRTGTTIRLAGSQFGRMLWGPARRAIYIFQRDPKGRTVCYGECARAWPPVYTRGKPRAGSGVRAALLGTVTRRDGRRQVTYAGKPLYYYAHEGRGEVRCHNVNLNGGLWWVVGPDGRRRP